MFIGPRGVCTRNVRRWQGSYALLSTLFTVVLSYGLFRDRQRRVRGIYLLL